MTREEICFNKCPHYKVKLGNNWCPVFGRRLLSAINNPNLICTKGYWGKEPMTNNLFFIRDKKVDLVNLYKDQKIFLLCNGPSRNKFNTALLKQNGIMTMTINNGGTYFKSNLWSACDSVHKFTRQIWFDPTILKFIPKSRYKEKIKDTNILAGELPSTILFEPKSSNDLDNWFVDNIYYNTTPKCSGNIRSTMLSSIGILYFLGFRTIFLLGADFNMDKNNPYCFNEIRKDSSVAHNNRLFKFINDWFGKMDFKDLKIYNCTPDSGLTNCEYMDFNKAIELSEIKYKDNTLGMY